MNIEHQNYPEAKIDLLTLARRCSTPYPANKRDRLLNYISNSIIAVQPNRNKVNAMTIYTRYAALNLA